MLIPTPPFVAMYSGDAMRLLQARKPSWTWYPVGMPNWLCPVGMRFAGTYGKITKATITTITKPNVLRLIQPHDSHSKAFSY
jgi:hypothetical protein